MPARWSSHLATRPWSWTTSTPSGWPTWWSTRSAGGPSRPPSGTGDANARSEEHTSELQSRENLVCRLLLEKKKKKKIKKHSEKKKKKKKKKKNKKKKK